MELNSDQMIEAGTIKKKMEKAKYSNDNFNIVVKAKVCCTSIDSVRLS